MCFTHWWAERVVCHRLAWSGGYQCLLWVPASVMTLYCQEWSCRDGKQYSAFSKLLHWGRREIGLYGYFSSKKNWWKKAWCTASAVAGCCTHCTAPLTRASRSACRSWTPWGHHLHHICGTLTMLSKAGIVAVLKNKLIRVHTTLHFREHSQLDTGWF